VKEGGRKKKVSLVGEEDEEGESQMHFLNEGNPCLYRKKVTAPNGHNPRSISHLLHNLPRRTDSSKVRVSRFALAQIVSEEKRNACTRVSVNRATRKLNPGF